MTSTSTAQSEGSAFWWRSPIWQIRRGIFIVGVFLACALPVTGRATPATEPAAECASGDEDFNGSRQPRHAVIVGPAASHIRLYRQDPRSCATADAVPGCEGKAYLIPGDEVVVGSGCGDFLHVRYVGKRTSTGWVDARAVRWTQAGESHSGPEAAQDFLSRIVGYYVSSGLCSETHNGQPAERCGEGWDTCMIIKRIDQSHAELHIESFQTNGHECGVSGVAQVADSQLTYVQGVEHDEDDGRGFTVRLEGDELKIRYIDDGQAHDTNAFCAINANLERVTFKQKDRQAIAGHTCGH